MTRAFFISIIALIVFGSARSLGDEEPERATQNTSKTNVYSFLSMPQRVDIPLRVTNISDAEVRAVRSIVAGIYPGAVVNIGGVTNHCRCEDGPACSAQVWVVADGLGQSHGLVLSKIEGQWQVGPLQAWWLVYEELVVRMRGALNRNGTRVLNHLEIYPWHAHYGDQSEEYLRLAEEQGLLWEQGPKCLAET